MRLSLPRFALAVLLACGIAPAHAGWVQVWSVASPKNTEQEGWVRFTNHSAVTAEVEIFAFDDKGVGAGPSKLTLQPRASVLLSAQDLKAGNAAKGLVGELGEPASGEWWLDVYSHENIAVASYVRSLDGLLANMSDAIHTNATVTPVPMLNESTNVHMRGELRIVNPDTKLATVEIDGINDAGQPGESTVKISVPGGGAVRVTAAQLESGVLANVITAGKLGNSNGKWRLNVKTNTPVRIMSLVRGPNGYLSNISGIVEENISAIPTCADLNGAAIVSQEAKPVYLGFIGAASGDSIFNTAGEYGSATGALSVRNTSGAYGSTDGAFSAMNKHTTTPPLVIRDGRVLAALTANVYYTKYRRLSISALEQSCEPTATERGAF